MICLRSSEVVIQNQIIEIPQYEGFSYKEHLKKGNCIVVFDSARAVLYPIIEWIKPESSQKKYFYKTKISTSYERKINPVIIDTIFNKKSFYLVDNDTFEKWVAFSLALESPASILNIKVKENSYLRLIYINPSRELFIESYLNWSEWFSISQELCHLREEVNLCIKNNQVHNLKEKFDCMKSILNRILIQAEIPLTISINENFLSRLNIIFNNSSIFFPLELMENLLVHYKIPFPGIISPGKNRPKKMTFIYSDDLLFSFNEIQKIAKNFEKNLKIEVFQDKNYNDYKHNLHSSDIIHFIGHGMVEKNYGKIIMDKESIDRFYHIKSPMLIFLNCCHSGLFTEGIIENLIEQNCRFVVASPYEIPDTNMENHIFDFYDFLNPDNISVSYYLNSLKNPLFKVFYRLYSGYQNRIV